MRCPCCGENDVVRLSFQHGYSCPNCEWKSDSQSNWTREYIGKFTPASENPESEKTDHQEQNQLNPQKEAIDLPLQLELELSNSPELSHCKDKNQAQPPVLKRIK